MLRILHTADWHLKAKHRYSNIAEGKLWDRMCDEKLKTLHKFPAIAEKLKVDLIDIAGDIFDTSNPPEFLKAEVCKILNKFTKPVIVITGRPGDHDYVSENNYVLMDLKEAYGEWNDKITIVGKNVYEDEQLPGLLFSHLMLEGINEFYKKTVKLNDEMFKRYETILLGDYHGYYHKQYAGKNFIYCGPPYPTRYGENCNGFVIVEIDETTGKLLSHKHYNIKTFQLFTCITLEENLKCEFALPYILKYKLSIKSDELAKIVRHLESRKTDIMNKDSLCMDVIWEINTTEGNQIINAFGKDKTLQEVCTDFIKENGGENFAILQKLFNKFYKECA